MIKRDRELVKQNPNVKRSLKKGLYKKKIRDENQTETTAIV